jgi:6,7-dimethyl-8-ribityllumazine synthase
MLRAARREFRAAGVRQLRVVRVPGAFEIPVVAARLAHEGVPPVSAVLCLGVIFQGETAHARHIGDAVSQALAQLQIASRIPIIHGVYHFESEKQARVRCLDPRHNRGTETARTALAMARVCQAL